MPKVHLFTISARVGRVYSLKLSRLYTINGGVREASAAAAVRQWRRDPKRESPASHKHNHTAPLRENPREEEVHRPPEEGAPQAFHPLLHLPRPRLLRPVLRLLTPPVPPLLGPNHPALPGPPHLLRLGGADAPVHQRVQVPAALPQTDAGTSHGEAEGDEGEAER